MISGKKILTIDDDPSIRKTLSDILKLKGYEPLAAENGLEGLKLLAQSSANLVIIDLGLPDISGLDVLFRVKADHPGTEAIILTGNATLDSAIEATNKGAFSFLLKPYDINQLFLHIRHAIDKQEARETIVEHAIELEKMNAELKSLYEISLAINQTVNINDLASKVLQAVIKVEFIGSEGKCAIFIVEKDRGVRLVSSRGIPAVNIEARIYRQIEEYLCSRAAATGELFISEGTMNAGQYTSEQPEATYPSVIVPLKTANCLIGALFLSLKADMELAQDETELLLSIGNQIATAIENAQHYEEIETASLHDSLTGLANRRFLEIELEKNFESAKRYNEQLSAIMLDIDHFKEYNDSQGHIEGDKILVKLADILLRETRGPDRVFRYGGEEFLIILPQTDVAQACDVAERLRKMVEAEMEITISLGVAAYQDNMTDSERLVNCADFALYRAKREGRNRVVAVD